MEAEVRAILEDAARNPDQPGGLFTAIRERFGAAGGVDLELPARRTPARAPDLDS
jgi:plasmid stability protein